MYKNQIWIPEDREVRSLSMRNREFCCEIIKFYHVKCVNCEIICFYCVRCSNY